MKELISVIVPVYNVEDYLPRCLDCLSMQTYRNLEIILVDDGSTDNSGRICDDYATFDPRARVIHHESKIGVWAARNTGQDVATGDYLWFPDSDDYFHKDILKIMYEAINQDLLDGEGKYDVAIVKHKRTDRLDEDVFFEVEPSYVKKTIDEIWDIFVHPEADISTRNVWCRLCRRDIVENIRTGNYKYAQDCDFSAKLYSKKPNIVFIDNVLYYWVVRSNSQMNLSDFQMMSKVCCCRLAFNNIKSIQEETSHRYLLEFLYNTIAEVFDPLNRNRREEGKEIRQEFREIIDNTWKEYLFCREIRTFWQRLVRILRVRFDRLYWMCCVMIHCKNDTYNGSIIKQYKVENSGN